MSDDVYCVEDGCHQPATDERPLGMVGEDLVVELVCADHAEQLATYAQRLADDPDVQADIERIDAALASGDEQMIKDVLGDPIDIDALREKFDVPAATESTRIDK